jgi:sugar/nucleoside kinase (ribokinase family)
MTRILGLGNALVDIITLIDNDSVLERFALPKGSMQLVDNERSEIIKSGTSDFKRFLASGGSAANTIHGLAMLGITSGFIGTVGKDETGDFFENDMKNAGVTTLLHRSNSATGTAVALISPDSERTFATHLGAAVDFDSVTLDPANFKQFDILYIEGYLINNKTLIEKAVSIAKENKMKIALDLASYNVVEANIGIFRKIITEYTDIVFANEEEAKTFTGKGPEEALRIISDLCEIAIIKVGSAGSWIKRGDEVIKVDALPVKCHDTTGAGDLYASGFLYGLAKGLNLEKCGLIGSVLAGHVIEIIGARMNDTKWNEIKKIIQRISDSD